MKKQHTAQAHDLTELTDDAKALLAATGHLAEEKVVEARERLSAALERAKDTWENVQGQAMAGVKATDVAIREHPYQAIGVAFGVGAILGYLLARKQ